MGSYSVDIKPSARKELWELPNDVLARAVFKIESLAVNPRPAGCKKLRGFKDLWRVRVGDWRVVYTIDDTLARVTIARIGHRKDVYEP